jgi:uncharacterized protein YtpQ (UPF0354 family)
VPGLEAFSGAVPQFFPAQWLENAPDLAFTDFPSRIRVGYVVRQDGGYSYIMRHTLEEAGVSVNELHTYALQNLRELPCPGLTVGKTPGGPEAFLTDVADNFRAVRILLPAVQNALVRAIGEEFLVAIPCRDWFVCWSKAQSTEWQEKNIAQARSDFIQDDYNLTPDILLRSKAGFSLFLRQELEA